MDVPLPLIDEPVGLGDILAAVIHGLIGGTPCLPCQKRASVLNKIVTFQPLGEK